MLAFCGVALFTLAYFMSAEIAKGQFRSRPQSTQVTPSDSGDLLKGPGVFAYDGFTSAPNSQLDPAEPAPGNSAHGGDFSLETDLPQQPSQETVIDSAVDLAEQQQEMPRWTLDDSVQSGVSLHISDRWVRPIRPDDTAHTRTQKPATEPTAPQQQVSETRSDAKHDQHTQPAAQVLLQSSGEEYKTKSQTVVLPAKDVVLEKLSTATNTAQAPKADQKSRDDSDAVENTTWPLRAGQQQMVATKSPQREVADKGRFFVTDHQQTRPSPDSQNASVKQTLNVHEDPLRERPAAQEFVNTTRREPQVPRIQFVYQPPADSQPSPSDTIPDRAPAVDEPVAEPEPLSDVFDADGETVIRPDVPMELEGVLEEYPVYSAGCYSSEPGWYTVAEVFLATREGDDGASLSNDIFLEDFGHVLGGRLTIGRRRNSIEGWEASFVTPGKMEATAATTGVSLNSKFVAQGGVNISAFNGANSHFQEYTNELYSGELLCKKWGWDVISTTKGLRYIHMGEDFDFISVDANGDLGIFDLAIDNHLIGPQLGLDMLFPIGRWTFASKTKLGIFANFVNSTTSVTNAGVVQLNNDDRDVEFAAIVDVGYSVAYWILPRVNVRVGYEAWYIYGVALAPEQTVSPLNPATTGRNQDAYGDVFYHGGTLGIEAIW